MTPGRWLADHEQDLVHRLSEWVRIRSVAGLPERAVDVRRPANSLAGAFPESGFPVVEVWPADSAPAVYAEWAVDPVAATVLVYSHH